MAVVYTIWNVIAHPDLPFVRAVEWVGTVALLFTALMSILIAFYLGRVHNAQGGELPEDVLTSDIDDGDPEQGEFSPWSWWPIVLASSAALGMMGLAIGNWLFPIGVGVFVSPSSAGCTSTTAGTSRADPCHVRLRAAAASDIGPHRAVNQDAAFTAPWGAAVADGVGGGPAGDLASAAFIHRLAAGAWPRSTPNRSP